MSVEEFKKYLDSKDYAYEENEKGITITYSGDLDLLELESIPENVSFWNGGYVDLRALEKIPTTLKISRSRSVWFKEFNTHDWELEIDGIRSSRLITYIISKGKA
jgi:hypothetical protein